MNPRTVLAALDEHAHAFIVGRDVIAAAAKMSPAHFSERYLDVPASCQLVGPGARSCHTGLGHYYEAYGETVTHPGSAAAWGRNIRDHVAAERRARVPGWFGSSSCPTSAGPMDPLR